MILNDKLNKSNLKKSKISLNISKLAQDIDSLSNLHTFKIEEKPLSLHEMEMLEEDRLEKTFKDLGHSFRINDKDRFLRNLMNLKKESLNSPLEDRNSFLGNSFINSLEPLNLLDYSNINMSNFKECSTTDTIDSIKHMICQNVEVTNDRIKIMVIGEKHVGKSFFLSRITNSMIEDLNNSTSERYIAILLSLEIKHHIINLYGKYTRVEYWDVSTTILNSPLIKSKFIYKFSLLPYM